MTIKLFTDFRKYILLLIRINSTKKE